MKMCNDPYGQGGFGQRNMATNQITGYQSAPKPADAFEIQQDPLGRGGSGQFNTTTGQMMNYYPAEKQPTTWQDSSRGDIAGQESSTGKFDPYPTQPTTWEDTVRDGIAGQESSTGKFTQYPEQRSRWEVTELDGSTVMRDQYGDVQKLPGKPEDWRIVEFEGIPYQRNESTGEMKPIRPKKTAMQEKLDNIQSLGYSEEEAIRTEAGLPLAQELPETAAKELPDGTKTAMDYVNSGEVTGIGSAFRAMSAKMLGGLGIPNNEETLEARRGLDIITQTAARALAQSPRFAEAERQWILETLNISPQIFNSPEGMAAEIRAMHSQFSNQLHNYLEIANSPGTPKKESEAYGEKARVLNYFLKLLGVEDAQAYKTQEQGLSDLLGSNDAIPMFEIIGDESFLIDKNAPPRMN